MNIFRYQLSILWKLLWTKQFKRQIEQVFWEQFIDFSAKQSEPKIHLSVFFERSNKNGEIKSKSNLLT